MINKTIYTVGGTVQAGSGFYIKRKADDELLEYCRAGEFAFILSSRQVGKSSLMVRTAQQLEKENIRSVIIDLSSIGVKISADEWYLGILNDISNTLNLQTDIFSWWSERAGLGPAQRLTNFFRDVLLKEVQEPVVIFFDEIDSTLSIPFADDFFAALRAIYNARSTVEDFKRLSFVMIGVATPSDLIADDKRTPFNIGHRVDLTDFTPEEALPLAGELGAKTMGWVFAWTGGHPYLTQRLCAHLARNKVEHTEETVAAAVRDIFEGEQGKQDNNLQFVRDMLTKRAPDIQRVLKTYKDVRSGKTVPDDERSMPKSHLKISGVVRRSDVNLSTRNRIYERNFDLKWIRENTPSTTARKLVISSSIVAIIALAIAGAFAWQSYTRTPAERAAQFDGNFQNAQTPKERLKNLAGLFELQDETYAAEARQLFNDLPQEDKLALFVPSASQSVREDQIAVVQGVYTYLKNSEEENTLLEEMAKVAPPFEDEIQRWLEGRRILLTGKDYDLAVEKITLAIGRNDQNPALYYDRAQAYIGLGETYYPKALMDLNTMLQIDGNRRSDARRLIFTKPFVEYWNEHATDTQYAVLADAIVVYASGIAVSYWDAEIDWVKVKNFGIEYAFMKATEGDSYQDPTFQDNWEQARKAGIFGGTYHFFHANINPIAQAENFIQTVKSVNGFDELLPVLDIETNDGQSNEEIMAGAKIWLDMVEQELGKRPVIYSGQYFLQDKFSVEGGSPPIWASKYPLWLAQYPNNYVEGMTPVLPRGWSDWAFWQYSEKGVVNGINASAYIDTFNGSTSDLQQFIADSSISDDQQSAQEKTFADLTQPIDANPSDAQAYVIRAIAYMYYTQYRQAISDFDQAIKIRPDYAVAYLNRGRAYEALGQLEKSAADNAKYKELTGDSTTP